MGKCVAWDTPIVDPRTGAMRTAAEIFDSALLEVDVPLLSLSDDASLVATSASALLDDGIKPVFLVETRAGRRIRITASHPLLSQHGWRPLEQLHVGDSVAAPAVLPIFGSQSLPDAEIDLLALLIGDGSIGPGSTTPAFTCALPEIVDVARAAAQTFGADLMFNALAGASTTYRISCGRSGGAPNPVTEMLRRHSCWGSTAHDKRVPAAVFTAPRPQVVRFLNRLFATDGTAWVAKAGYARIGYATVSEQLSLDVMHLLLRFGIRSKRRTRWVAYKGTRRRAFEVEIMDSASMREFCAEIGILGKDSAVERVAARVADSPANQYTIDTVPMEVWDDVVKAKGERSWASISIAAGKPRSHNWHAYRRTPRRETIARLAEVLDDDRLRWWASPAVTWDRITAITPVGNDRVIDFTVPQLHNFVAADLFVHNTALGLGIATHVAKNTQKPVLVFSLEMGHAELTQRILSSEAEVESQKLRSGRLVEADWTKIGRAINRIDSVPLYLDDNPRVTVMEIRAKARRLKARHGGLALIMIDYLQLMSGGMNSENRQLEVSEISRGLKILARELDTPIIALSQLSRNLESRADKRPMLADLRESGCLTADTQLVRADNNQPITLGELVAQGATDVPVWSLDERYRLVEGTVTNAFSSGVKEVFRLRFSSGRVIEASGSHPFLSLDGWVRVEDMKVGDRFAGARRLPEVAATAPMAEAELILLGHLIGDGCTLARHAVQYTTIDQENVAAVVAAALHFGVTARVKKERNWMQVYLPSPTALRHGKHHPISDWLRGLGAWDLRSWEKRIPAPLFSLPPAQIALFLRHLWATDGSVSSAVYYATSSRELAHGVADLLLRLDICTRLRVVRASRGRTQYQVEVSGVDNERRFAEVVGVHGTRGRQLVERMVAKAEVKPNPNVDSVPAEVWDHVRYKALPAAGMTARQLASALQMSYCGSALYKSGVSRARLGRVAAATGDQWLADLAGSDVLWDRLLKVEPLGEIEVFDATVEPHHNFVANGLVAHNSLEQDADVVMFLYRDEVYNRDSPDKASAELIIAKHRSGPTGVARLVFRGQYTKFGNAARGV
jgi:replicative DNA helicase